MVGHVKCWDTEQAHSILQGSDGDRGSTYRNWISMAGVQLVNLRADILGLGNKRMNICLDFPFNCCTMNFASALFSHNIYLVFGITT